MSDVLSIMCLRLRSPSLLLTMCVFLPAHRSVVDIARGASGPRPREEQQRDANEREGYHGTSSSAAKEIMKHGFRRSTGGMLGPGVYCTFTHVASRTS